MRCYTVIDCDYSDRPAVCKSVLPIGVINPKNLITRVLRIYRYKVKLSPSGNERADDLANERLSNQLYKLNRG